MEHKRLDDLLETKMLLTTNGQFTENSSTLKKMFKEDLLKMVDCKGLENAGEFLLSHSWILDGSAFFPGSDYIM